MPVRFGSPSSKSGTSISQAHYPTHVTRHWLGGTLLFLILNQINCVPARAGAPGCEDANIRPIQGSSGYRARSNDARCEGFFESPVSVGGLEVVSFTVGNPEFDIQSEDSLAISAPYEGISAAQFVNIRAVALPLRTYYRMDTRLTSTRPMTWPVTPILRPWGLSSKRVGIFGWISRDDRPLFIPIRVGNGKGGSSASTRVLVLKLRSPAPLDRLLWRTGDDRGAKTPWRSVTDSDVRSGETVTFRLPPGPIGIAEFEFRAKRQNTDIWYPLDISIWRPAP